MIQGYHVKGRMVKGYARNDKVQARIYFEIHFKVASPNKTIAKWIEEDLIDLRDDMQNMLTTYLATHGFKDDDDTNFFKDINKHDDENATPDRG